MCSLVSLPWHRFIGTSFLPSFIPPSFPLSPCSSPSLVMGWRQVAATDAVFPRWWGRNNACIAHRRQHLGIVTFRVFYPASHKKRQLKLQSKFSNQDSPNWCDGRLQPCPSEASSSSLLILRDMAVSAQLASTTTTYVIADFVRDYQAGLSSYGTFNGTGEYMTFSSWTYRLLATDGLSSRRCLRIR